MSSNNGPNESKDKVILLNEDLIITPEMQAILFSVIIADLFTKTRTEQKQSVDVAIENDKLRELFCRIVDNIGKADMLMPYHWLMLGIPKRLSARQLKKFTTLGNTGSAEDLYASAIAKYLSKKIKS